jgi:excisionase family DNA binding protein
MKDHLTITQAATVLGICVNTLRKYDRQGVIKSRLTPGGHRRFDFDDLLRFKREVQEAEKNAVMVARKAVMDSAKKGNR